MFGTRGSCSFSIESAANRTDVRWFATGNPIDVETDSRDDDCSPCSSSALESGTSGHPELREDEGCGGHEQEELGHRDPLLTAVLHLRVLRAPDQRAISADTMAEVLSVTQMTGES